MVYDGDAPLSDGQGVAASIMLRPLGSPLPLGVLALAPAGLLLSCLQIGAFSVSESKTVALLVIAFAAPLELLAAIFCFLARDTLGGSGLGVFAARGLPPALCSCPRLQALRVPRSEYSCWR